MRLSLFENLILILGLGAVIALAFTSGMMMSCALDEEALANLDMARLK